MLVLFCMAAFSGWAISGCYLNVGYLRLVCPAGFIELLLTSRSLPVKVLPGFLLSVAGILLMGRFFCGWICPGGYIGEQVKKISRVNLPSLCNPAINNRARCKLGLKDACALLLGLMIGMAVFRFPLMCLFCPLGVVSRNLIEFFTHYSLRVDLILLGILPLLALVFDFRTAPLCPSGIIRAVFSRFGIADKPAVDGHLCVSCGHCKTVCPATLGPLSDLMQADVCLQCHACISACPASALEARTADAKLSRWPGKGPDKSGR